MHGTQHQRNRVQLFLETQSGPTARSRRAIDVALIIADRLADPQSVLRLSDHAYDRLTSRGLSGFAGLAMLYAGILQSHDRPEYRAALHAYMKLASRAGDLPVLGLHTGVSGLLAACDYAAIVEPRYSTLADKCVEALANAAAPTQSEQHCASMDEYDLISGASGIAIALSGHRGEFGRSLCGYLGNLLSDSRNWSVQHPLRPEEGDLNDLGLAHGVAGMLAAMGLTENDHQKYAASTRSALEFLIAQRDVDSGEWPASVASNTSRRARNAWCYGAPGCLSGVFLGARYVADSSLEMFAIQSLRKLVEMPMPRWQIPDYAICHGHAGNALIYASIGRCAGAYDLVEFGLDLRDKIVDGFDETLPFGYAAVADGGLADAAGLLQGSAGIALALLTLSGGCDPSWVRCFGLPVPLRA
jgi:lantibiotic biosynthesis protein